MIKSNNYVLIGSESQRAIDKSSRRSLSSGRRCVIFWWAFSFFWYSSVWKNTIEDIVCLEPEGRYVCIKWYELMPFWLWAENMLSEKDYSSNALIIEILQYVCLTRLFVCSPMYPFLCAVHVLFNKSEWISYHCDDLKPLW